MLVLCSTARAQHYESTETDPVTLSDEQGRYPLGRYLEILEDPSGELTIEEVSSPEYDALFSSSQTSVPNFGLTDSAYWLRLGLRNEAPQIDHWLLDVGYANTHFVDLYTPLADGEGFAVKQSGNLRPPESRDLRHPRIVFAVDVPTEVTEPLYLRVQSGAAMSLPLTLWRPVDFLAHSAAEQGIHGIYFGILLGLLGYNLFLFFSLREASHLYLVIVLANMIFFEAAYLGYTEAYLASGIYFLRPIYFPLSFALIFLSMLLFADSFLTLTAVSPGFHRVTIAAVGIWGILILLIPFASYYALAWLMIPWALVSLVLVLASGFVAWWKGFRSARFFLIAWFGLVAALLLVLLVRLGVISSTVFGENAYRLGSVWMALCWSIALADRINLLKSETDSANSALRSSELRLSQILEGLPLGVVVYGSDHKPTYINRRVVEILSNPPRGVQPDISAGRTLAQAMDYFAFRVAGTDINYPLEEIPIYHALQGDAASADDIEADLFDRRVPLEMWASPVLDSGGSVESAVIAFQDITRRKRTEAEVAEYRHHLERLVDQRTAELSETNTLLKREVAEHNSLAELQLKLIDWLSIVNQIHQSLGGMADLPNAYEKLLAAIADSLGAKSAFIGMWNGNSDQIDVLCWVRPDHSPAPMQRFPALLPSDSSPRREIEQGELIVLTADQLAQALAPLQRDYLQGDRPASFTLVPIQGANQPVSGLFGLGLMRPAEAYPSEEITLLTRMAFDLAGLAAR